MFTSNYLWNSPKITNIRSRAPFHKKILRAIVIVNTYQEQKCASQKIMIPLLRVFSKVTKLKEWLDVVVTIVCWHTMALLVFLQEDEVKDAPNGYRNLKIFVKLPPVYSAEPLFGTLSLYTFRHIYFE